MEERPVRKSVRLKEYDYSAPGAYFLTICTQNRRCILSNIIMEPQTGAVGALHEAPAVPVVRLTPEGQCVARILDELPTRFPMLAVDRAVIMPNHVHLLLRITGERALREAPLQEDRKRSVLSKAVGYLKANSSKEIRRFQPGEVIWQRVYYDHVARNEEDYRQIWEYIEGNPARWAEDRFYMPQ